MDRTVIVLCDDLKHTKKLEEGWKFYTIDLKTLEIVESYVCEETIDSNVVKFESEEGAKAYVRKIFN